MKNCKIQLDFRPFLLLNYSVLRKFAKGGYIPKAGNGKVIFSRDIKTTSEAPTLFNGRKYFLPDVFVNNAGRKIYTTGDPYSRSGALWEEDDAWGWNDDLRDDEIRSAVERAYTTSKGGYGFDVDGYTVVPFDPTNKIWRDSASNKVYFDDGGYRYEVTLDTNGNYSFMNPYIGSDQTVLRNVARNFTTNNTGDIFGTMKKELEDKLEALKKEESAKITKVKLTDLKPLTEKRDTLTIDRNGGTIFVKTNKHWERI